MAIRNTEIFAEIMYTVDNSNSNSYTNKGNSNRGNKVDTIRIMHNSNRGNINEIVKVSSNLSINATMRITSGSSC